MISSANATTITKTDEEDLNESIYVDPDVCITKQDHLSFLQDAVKEIEDPEADYFINEIINLLLDENKESVDSDDVRSILETMDFGNYKKTALHVFKPFHSYGRGTCKPKSWVSTFPWPQLPIIPKYCEWNGKLTAVTKVGLLEDNPLAKYTGKQEGWGVTDWFSLDAESDGVNYDITGMSFFIFIKYDWSPFQESAKSYVFPIEKLNLLIEKISMLAKFISIN
jgi:hypothetical protein